MEAEKGVGCCGLCAAELCANANKGSFTFIALILPYILEKCAQKMPSLLFFLHMSKKSRIFAPLFKSNERDRAAKLGFDHHAAG